MTTTIKFLYTGFLTIALVAAATCCKAQLDPNQSVYFQNRYLLNPAMAGFEKGLTVNLDYGQQWFSFPGGPKSQILTAEYQATEKVGVGLNINDEQEGFFRQTRIMGTYAYHLPLNGQNQKLNFGISAGINDTRINYNSVNGNLTDPELLQYNNRKPFFDGDLGISYTSDHLFAEVSMPNINTNIFNRDSQNQDIDRTVFFAIISYNISLSNETGAFSLEPLAAYRQIKGYTKIFDTGFNFKMNDYHLDLQAIYHSNDNFGVGVVFDQPVYAINLNYNIFTGQITTYTSGDFELGIKVKLGRR